MRFTQWAVAMLAVAAGSTAQANLITNSSFEAPTLPARTYAQYFGGSTDITGWTVVGADVAVVEGQYSENGAVFQAQEGNQWLDLSGVSSNSMTNGVRQDVSTTIGQEYDLSFYVGSLYMNPGGYEPTTIDLSINGGPRVSYHNPAMPTTMLDWKLFTTQFTATSSSTSITFFNGSGPGNHGSGLDNVSLTTAAVAAVPEPTSSALLVIASAGMMCVRFRRNRSAKQA